MSSNESVSKHTEKKLISYLLQSQNPVWKSNHQSFRLNNFAVKFLNKYLSSYTVKIFSKWLFDMENRENYVIFPHLYGVTKNNIIRTW